MELFFRERSFWNVFLLSSLILLVSAFLVSATIEGPNSAGSTGENQSIGSASWTTPDSILSNDGGTTISPSGSDSYYLTVQNWTFDNISSTDSITGILVEFDSYRTGPQNCLYNSVRLVDTDGSIIGDDRAGDSSWGNLSNEINDSFGGLAEDWSVSLTGADVNNTNFGVAISVNSSGPGNCVIDYVSMSLNYTESGSSNFHTSESYGSNWTMTGRYHNRTGFIGGTDYFNISNAVVNTSFTCSEGTTAQTFSRNVLLYNDIIYLGCDDNGIYALNATNLSHQLDFHNLSASNLVITDMLYANDSIYFGEAWNFLVGHLNASNLSQSFSNFSLGTGIGVFDYIKSITAYNQSLFFNYLDFPTYGARTYELNLSNLSQIITNSSIQTKDLPIIFNNTFFVSGLSGVFHELNLSDIDQNLSTISFSTGLDYPVISNGSLLLSLTNSTSYYYNPSNIGSGALASFAPPNPVSAKNNPLGFGADSLYVHIDNGTVFQYNSTDLSQIASYSSLSTPPLNFIQPLTTDNSVFFSDIHNITQLNSTNVSKFIGNYTFENGTIDYLIASGDSIYVKVSNTTTKIVSLYRLTSGDGGGGGDSISPIVNLQAPSNGSTVTNESVSFNVTFSDDTALSNATFFLWNQTGSVVTTNLNGTISGTADSINYTYALPALGTYFWNYLANDTSGNAAFNSTNWTVIYAAPTAPLLIFETPTPSDYYATTNTSFDINVSIIEENLNDLRYNWNGSNYNIYNESLVLMMNFDDYTRLNDTSSYTNHGSCDSCPTFTSDGRYNGAYSFNGIDQNVSLGAPDELLFGDGNWTLAAWIKNPESSTGGSELIVSQGRGGTGGIKYQIGLLAAGHPYASVDDNSAAHNVISYDTNASDDDWHYIVGQRTDNLLKIYVDGILENSTDIGALGSLGSPDGFVIGSEARSKDWFNGTIDEVRVWNRSLSAEEVYIDYASNLRKQNASLWYLSVNQSKNSTAGLDVANYTYYVNATDSSGNNNQTETRVINITDGSDTTSPEVTINFPTNVSYGISDLSLDLNVTLSENGSVSYSFDSGVNNVSMTGSEGSAFGLNFNATNSSLASGSYTFQVYANDTSGNDNNTESVVFSFDGENPIVNLVGPSNGSVINSAGISFNGTFLDNINVTNITFFLWNQSGSEINSSLRGIGTSNQSDFNLTVTLSEGLYFWNYLAVDSSGNRAFNVTNWTVNYSIPDSFPLVEFVAPTEANYSNSSLSSEIINFTVNESSLKSIEYNWNGTNYTLFNESLFLLFNFDNESAVGDNSTWIADLSGNNYSAQFRGNADYDEGKYGSGIYFDGTGDYLALETWEFTGSGEIHEMTVCTWFKTNFSQNSNYFNNWAFLDYDRSEYFNFFITPQGLLGFSTRGTSGGINDFYGTNVANDDEWHYGCAVFDSSETDDKKLYLDGEIENQEDVYSAGVRLGSGTDRFGFIGDGSEAISFDGSRNNKGYYGLIDELVFWNRSLSDAEIRQSYYTNIKKYDGDYWSISVDQVISTDTLDYMGCATDSADQVNCTEHREIVVDTGEPVIGIISPLQRVYMNSTLDFNVTLDRSGDSCYYILDDPQSLNEVVASWKFEGNANDLVGDHDGSVNGAVLNSSGRDGKAYQFDGINDYIFFSDSSLINTGVHQNRTVALWFRADDISSSTKQVLYEEGGSTRGLNIYLEDSKLYAGGWNRQNSESDWEGTWLSTENISSNVWHHVTLVLSGNQDVNDGALRAFIDGAKYGTGNGSQLWKHGNDINFGRSGDNTVYHDGVDSSRGEYFAGMVDEAFIINSRLSDSDVATLYNFNSSNMTRFNETYFNYTHSGLLEGAHDIVFYCNSSVGAWSNTDTRYFGIDYVPPGISLNYPENYEYFSSSEVQFNFTVEDDGDGIDTCSLYGSWGGGWHVNYSIQNVNQSVLTNITRTLDDGEYIWNVYCNETTGGADFSQQGNYTVIVDSQNPEIEIDYPLNITYTGAVNNLNYSFIEDNFASCWYTLDSGVTNITTSCSGTVDSGLVSYEGTNIWTFYINDSAGNQNSSSVTFVRNTPLFTVDVVVPENLSYGQSYMEFNVSLLVPDDDVIGDACNYQIGSDTNVSLSPINTSYFNQTNTSIGDGAYLTAFWCNATNGQENYLERVSFAIDNTPPLVTLNFPGNTSYAETNISVNISLNEAGGCEYSVNSGVRNYSLEAQDLDDTEFFDVRPLLDPGSYTLNAYCNDTGGNLNDTVSIVFAINDTVPPAITITSPLEQTYNSSSINYTVSLNENGTVRYSLDSGVTNESLSGDEGVFGTSFSGSNGSIANGVYNFTVYANDTLGNENQTSVVFTIDFSSGESEGDAGGGNPNYGGGSSGGSSSCQTSCGSWSACSQGIRARSCINSCTGSYIETVSCDTSICVSNWECSDWGSCSNGESTRDCVDLNGCGNAKPAESLECEVEDCIPDIFCGEQSECFYRDSVESVILGDISYNGVSYIYCEDRRSCTPAYTEEVACESGVEVYFLREEVCGEQTLVAKNVETDKPLTYVDLALWDEDRLSLSFVQEDVLYCPVCFDGLRNGNEEGIDCGGDCRPCSIELKESRWWLWILLILLIVLLMIEAYRYREEIGETFGKIWRISFGR